MDSGAELPGIEPRDSITICGLPNGSLTTPGRSYTVHWIMVLGSLQQMTPRVIQVLWLLMNCSLRLPLPSESPLLIHAVSCLLAYIILRVLTVLSSNFSPRQLQKGLQNLALVSDSRSPPVSVWPTSSCTLQSHCLRFHLQHPLLLTQLPDPQCDNTILKVKGLAHVC